MKYSCCHSTFFFVYLPFKDCQFTFIRLRFLFLAVSSDMDDAKSPTSTESVIGRQPASGRLLGHKWL